MANLQYSVWPDAKQVALGVVSNENVIVIGGTSTQSGDVVDPSAASRSVRYVRLHAESNCYVTWGSDPTATNDGTGGRQISADSPEYFYMEAGWKIACITRA